MKQTALFTTGYRCIAPYTAKKVARDYSGSRVGAGYEDRDFVRPRFCRIFHSEKEERNITSIWYPPSLPFLLYLERSFVRPYASAYNSPYALGAYIDKFNYDLMFSRVKRRKCHQLSDVFACTP